MSSARKRAAIQKANREADHLRQRLMLYRTNRRDCYRVVADGVEWKERIGWSKILAGLRKSLPRVGTI